MSGYLGSTDLLLLAAAVSSLLALLIALMSLLRSSKNARRLALLAPAQPGQDLFAVLAALTGRVAGLEKETAALHQTDEAQQALLRASLQAPAVVRFNAFAEMGSELSFSIAFVDGEGTGAVLTCIAGREEARVYAKPLTRGSSPYPLTHEEKEAIAKAAGIRHRTEKLERHTN